MEKAERTGEENQDLSNTGEHNEPIPDPVTTIYLSIKIAYLYTQTRYFSFSAALLRKIQKSQKKKTIK
jgi:hypothetical protein